MRSQVLAPGPPVRAVQVWGSLHPCTAHSVNSAASPGLASPERPPDLGFRVLCPVRPWPRCGGAAGALFPAGHPGPRRPCQAVGLWLFLQRGVLGSPALRGQASSL